MLYIPIDKSRGFTAISVKFTEVIESNKDKQFLTIKKGLENVEGIQKVAINKDEIAKDIEEIEMKD